MEKPGAADFIAATAADQGLQAEWSATETPTELVGVGERHGYAFDVVELETALRAVARVHAGELDDSELEQAAGGLLLLSLSGPGPLTDVRRVSGWPCKWTTRLGDVQGLGDPNLPPT